MYQQNTKDGYIVSIVKGVTNGNLTEEEYNGIIEVIRNKPIADKGFDYKLKENLTWELYDLPKSEEEETV